MKNYLFILSHHNIKCLLLDFNIFRNITAAKTKMMINQTLVDNKKISFVSDVCFQSDYTTSRIIIRKLIEKSLYINRLKVLLQTPIKMHNLLPESNNHWTNYMSLETKCERTGQSRFVF